MTKSFFGIGMIVTVIYVIAFVAIFHPQIISLPTLTANEVGDFFAGAFGPVAFFWLVLGFFQQGKELRQNNEALQLQARELKASVVQQKELVDATRLRTDAEVAQLQFERAVLKNKSLPRLILNLGGVSSGQRGIKQVLQFHNFGQTITKLRLSIDDVNASIAPPTIATFLANDEKKLSMRLEKDFATTEVTLQVKFDCENGTPGQKSFKVMFTPIHGLWRATEILDDDPTVRNELE